VYQHRLELLAAKKEARGTTVEDHGDQGCKQGKSSGQSDKQLEAEQSSNGMGTVNWVVLY